jgi:5-hydroxyisourate hydrolase-like protein (transthyretin family)
MGAKTTRKNRDGSTTVTKENGKMQYMNRGTNKTTGNYKIKFNADGTLDIQNY